MTSGQARLPVAPSMFKFAQHGKCGTWVSELLPHTAKCVDDIALVKTRSHERDQPRPGLHVRDDRQRSAGQAEHRLVAVATAWAARATTCRRSSCSRRTGRPAPRRRRCSRACGAAGSCPASTAASRSAASATRCCTCRTPTASSADDRRAMLDALGELNQQTFDRYGDPETLTRIAQYEMAFRMQTSVPDLTDLSQGTGEDARTVRPGGAQAGLVRGQRAAGPPAGRARRARGANPPPRLGPARQLAERHPLAVQGHRPADRRRCSRT